MNVFMVVSLAGKHCGARSKFQGQGRQRILAPFNDNELGPCPRVASSCLQRFSASAPFAPPCSASLVLELPARERVIALARELGESLPVQLDAQLEERPVPLRQLLAECRERALGESDVILGEAS